MRRGHLFWGGFLLAIGVLFLLDALGYLPGVSAWVLVWPILLIAIGLWVIGGISRWRRPGEAEGVSIPLEGAAKASLHIKHAAGRLSIGAGAIGDTLLAGSFGGGLDYQARRAGESLAVDMRVREPRAAFLPWGWHARGPLDWSFSLNSNVPLVLALESGANEAQLDLRDLRVSELQVRSGASSTRVTLPAAAGHTRVHIHVGAAAVDLRLPQGVAGRIRVRGALAGISVDQNRFPRTSSDLYQSPDYETAPNRAEVEIEAGVGSVSVR